MAWFLVRCSFLGGHVFGGWVLILVLVGALLSSSGSCVGSFLLVFSLSCFVVLVGTCRKFTFVVFLLVFSSRRPLSAVVDSSSSSVSSAVSVVAVSGACPIGLFQYLHFLRLRR